MQNSCLLASKCVINDGQIQISYILGPGYEIGKVLIGLVAELVGRVDDLLPPHAAHEAKGKNDETAAQHGKSEATVVTWLSFSSHQSDVSLLNSMLVALGSHHVLHRYAPRDHRHASKECFLHHIGWRHHTWHHTWQHVQLCKVKLMHWLGGSSNSAFCLSSEGHLISHKSINAVDESRRNRIADHGVNRCLKDSAHVFRSSSSPATTSSRHLQLDYKTINEG